MSHSYERIAELKSLMDGLPPDLGGMSIGQLEGYVAGILVCPETIPPSEWLPAVWDGDGASALTAR